MPFITSDFMIAVNSTTEQIAALALLDLPFESADHAYTTTDGRGMDIASASNLVLCKKDINEAENEDEPSLLIIHRFFELNNKHIESKIEEFLTHQVYGCEVIISNVSSRSQDFQVLWQIPEGSLPLNITNYQKSVNKSLGAYSTQTFDFFFYFPEAGDFIQFPSNIAKNGKVVARAAPCRLKVVTEATEVSFETFRDILASQDKDAILNFLSTANLLKGEKGFNFNDMYWLLDDKEMFVLITDILRRRKIYNNQVWGYGFKHENVLAIKEFLARNEHIRRSAGIYLDTDLLQVSPETENFRHLDYFPLINA